MHCCRCSSCKILSTYKNECKFKCVLKDVITQSNSNDKIIVFHKTVYCCFEGGCAVLLSLWLMLGLNTQTRGQKPTTNFNKNNHNNNKITVFVDALWCLEKTKLFSAYKVFVKAIKLCYLLTHKIVILS